MVEHSTWFHLASVPLGNGSGALLDDGDRVGVVVPWTWPDMMESVSVANLRAVQAKVAAGAGGRTIKLGTGWAS